MSHDMKLIFHIYQPLAEDDIDDFQSIDLEQLDDEELKILQYRLEDLRNDMEDREPEDRRSEEYRSWDRRLSLVEDFLDSVQDLIEARRARSAM